MILCIVLGEYTATVSAKGYSSSTKLVKIVNNKPEQIIFDIVKLESVIGLPRFVFILLTGKLNCSSIFFLWARPPIVHPMKMYSDYVLFLKNHLKYFKN